MKLQFTKNQSLISILLLFFIIISIVFIIIPAITLNSIMEVPAEFQAFTVLQQFSIFIILLFLPLLFKKSRFKIYAISILNSIYFTMIYFFVAFWYLTKNLFTPYYFIDSYDAIIPTGVMMFGKLLLIMFVLCLVFILITFCYLFITLYKTAHQYLTQNTPWILKFKYLLIVPVFLLPLIPPHRGFISYNYHVISESQKARNFFEPILPDYQVDLKNASDNIFILQLESVNALALQGRSEINGINYPENYIPNIHQIAKDGIFFPYFWSNSMQTDRAQENILCGIANNIGASFSMDPEAGLQNCLPQALTKAGYKTIAFRSDNLNFHNMGNFMSNLGFTEVHYQDIMKPEDIKYKWGYDDCTFYQRAFEYLKVNYPNPDKLLVYFEVSSTHIPWENKEQYAFADKISDPANYAERYINAESEQDYCLSKFYEEYQNYNPPQTHLLILADTSAPLGINDNDIFNFQNNYNESFITLFLYIPPREQKQNYQTDKIVTDSLFYSHNDILPTIYELLSQKNYPNSFVYELKKEGAEQNHEDCQMISQPYSGSYIIVINKNDKYIYSIVDKTVTRSDIKEDLWEKNSTLVETDVSFQDFKDRYFCQRYK